MSTESRYDEGARRVGRELAARLQNDPGFRAQVEADPAGVLRGAGLSEEATADFMREVGIEASVQGYIWCRQDSCYLTCFITGSP